jgi:hypothetical protein
MNIKPTEISADEFIKNLSFEYVELYSFQRGNSYLKKNEEMEREFDAISRRTELSETEKLRLEELDEKLNYVQYLISHKNEIHFSSIKTNTLIRSDPNFINIIEAFKIKPINIFDWMCAPTYRDAIIFYNENKQIISCLNICFSCEKMELQRFKNVIADSRTYIILKDLFIKLGHKIE